MQSLKACVFVAIVSAGVAACGGKEGATPDKSSSAKSGGKGSAAPSSSGSAAPAKSAVASPPVFSGAKVAVELPKYKPGTAKPSDLGGAKLTVTLCKFDAKTPMPIADSFSDAVGGMAFAPDDSLWLIDGDGKVRHYVNQDPAGCELALDTKVGEGGIFTVPDSKADERIGVDKSGVVYFNTGMGPKRIVAGKIESIDCSSSGRIAAGRESDVVFVGNYPLKDGKCGEKLELKEWKNDPFTEIMFVEKDGLDVKGTFEDGGSRVGQGAFHDFSGERKIAVGKKDGDEDIFYTHDVFGCALGLCVVDGNASSLRVWKKDGAFVGKVNLDDLTGVDVFPTQGEYAAGAMWIGGAGHDDMDKYPAFIAKITTGG